MRVLLTGAGGFIGGHLARRLSADGHFVYAVSRSDNRLHRGEIEERVHWIKADLSANIDGLEALEAFDVIIHCAAVHNYSTPPPSPAQFIKGNVLSTLYLAEFARKKTIQQFIYLSTVTIYGAVRSSILTKDTPVSEPDLMGATKYLAERILREYSEDFPVVVLRLPGVVGPGNFPVWIAKVVKRAVNHEPIEIYNADALYNNITDIHEVSRLLSFLLTKPLLGYSVFNVAAAEPIPVREAVECVVGVTQSGSPIIAEKTTQGSFSIDITSLVQKTGFQPDTTRAIISRCAKSGLGT